MLRLILVSTLFFSLFGARVNAQSDTTPAIESLLKFEEKRKDRAFYVLDLASVQESARLHLVNSLYSSKVLTVASPCNASTEYKVKLSVIDEERLQSELESLYRDALANKSGTENLKKKFNSAN